MPGGGWEQPRNLFSLAAAARLLARARAPSVPRPPALPAGHPCPCGRFSFARGSFLRPFCSRGAYGSEEATGLFSKKRRGRAGVTGNTRAGRCRSCQGSVWSVSSPVKRAHVPGVMVSVDSHTHSLPTLQMWKLLGEVSTSQDRPGWHGLARGCPLLAEPVSLAPSLSSSFQKPPSPGLPALLRREAGPQLCRPPGGDAGWACAQAWAGMLGCWDIPLRPRLPTGEGGGESEVSAPPGALFAPFTAWAPPEAACGLPPPASQLLAFFGPEGRTAPLAPQSPGSAGGKRLEGEI